MIGQPLRLVSTRRAWMLLLACMFFGVAQPGWAYSLLTHEELVDILWQDQITPLLLKRFPAATPAQLRQAHAYAYGGCLIQDIGYALSDATYTPLVEELLKRGFSKVQLAIAFPECVFGLAGHSSAGLANHQALPK